MNKSNLYRRKSIFGLRDPVGWRSILVGRQGRRQAEWLKQEAERSHCEAFTSCSKAVSPNSVINQGLCVQTPEPMWGTSLIQTLQWPWSICWTNQVLVSSSLQWRWCQPLIALMCWLTRPLKWHQLNFRIHKIRYSHNYFYLYCANGNFKLSQPRLVVNCLRKKEVYANILSHRNAYLGEHIRRCYDTVTLH